MTERVTRWTEITQETFAILSDKGSGRLGSANISSDWKSPPVAYDLGGRWMSIDDNGELRAEEIMIGGNWMGSGDSQGTRDAGSDAVASQPLDPAIFALLLGRIEQLSRELGRAETQRALIEQHIARLESQIEKLSRQQSNGS